MKIYQFSESEFLEQANKTLGVSVAGLAAFGEIDESHAAAILDKYCILAAEKSTLKRIWGKFFPNAADDFLCMRLVRVEPFKAKPSPEQ